MKKNIFSLSLLLLAASAFVACSDDDPETPKPKFDVISFESDVIDLEGNPVTLGDIEVVGGSTAATHHGVFWAQPFAAEYGDPEAAMGLTYDGPLFTFDNNIWFGSYYCDNTGWGYGRTDSWGGFVLSSNCNTTADAFDYKDQFCVYAKSGANSTSNFAVCYCNGMMGGAYGNPVIEFATEPRTVDHLYVAASTMLYTYYKYDLSAVKGRTWGVKITGSLAGEETGSVVATLVADSAPIQDWMKVDLASLGQVDRLEFTVDGLNPMVDFDPVYFCVDEIALVK